MTPRIRSFFSYFLIILMNYIYIDSASGGVFWSKPKEVPSAEMRETLLGRIPKSILEEISTYLDSKSVCNLQESSQYTKTTLSDARLYQVLPKFSKSLSFSSDGRKVAIVSRYGKVFSWDVSTRRWSQALPPKDVEERWVQFSPYNSNMIAVTDHNEKTVIWDMETERALQVFPYTGFAEKLRFSPDGSKILSMVAPGSIAIWDIRTGKWLQTFRLTRRGGILDGYGEFSPDSNKVVTAAYGPQEVIIWDIKTGDQLQTFRGDYDHAQFSPDGNKIVASGTRTVSVLDTISGEVLPILPRRAAAGTIAKISFDGSKVFAADHVGAIIWDVNTRNTLHTLPIRYINSAQFSADSSMVITSQGTPRGEVRNGSVIIWDVKTGAKLHTLKVNADVGGAQFSPEGGKVVITLHDFTGDQIFIWGLKRMVPHLFRKSQIDLTSQ